MKTCRRLLLLLLCLVGFLWIPSVRADDADATDAKVQFFEKSVRPVLVQHCYRCHGEKRQRGDLRVDSRAALLKGGSTGVPALVPGDPEKSLLVRAIRHVQEDLQMPPNKSLSKIEIANLVRWVKDGAVFPTTGNVAKQEEKHWGFQPMEPADLPKVNNAKWVRNPIDRFILAKLETAKITPAEKADRRTLLRRVTFDLTGLPPTVEEIHDFVSDTSPQAYEKVVERLLTSPHYGERWGRHWLDVARYADSNGLDENVAFGNAWKYRDYVVECFNKDVPYDRFVTEQLAGDLLSAKDENERHRQLIATGFLSLGPKVLAEVDQKKMEMDIIDEQVDTVGKAFMGLTLGCARCHNHKFDPIPMVDYYKLAGIFQSTHTMTTFKLVAKWHENVIATKEQIAQKKQHDEAMADLQKKIDVVIQENRTKLKLDAKVSAKEVEKKLPEAEKQRLLKLQENLLEVKTKPVELPTAMGVTEGKVVNAKLLQRGDHLKPGQDVERGFLSLFQPKEKTIPANSSGRLQLARWLTNAKHPLTARVMVNRLWRWHFGKGLVATPDNFGRLGKEPSHPQLLDWLAVEFVKNNWSMKHMHRLICLSQTYQMSGSDNPLARKMDPENRLYWRWERQRLDAESIRDSILAVSGQLNRTMGGSLLHVKNRDYFFNHTSKDLTKYNEPRRTLYLPVVRNNLYDVFQLFDSTDASVSNGDRATTTVPTQALFFMNSDLVQDASTALAKQLLAKSDWSAERRVQLLFEKAYGRLATRSESDHALITIQRFRNALPSMTENAELPAWSLYCQAIMASNEFLYVE